MGAPGQCPMPTRTTGKGPGGTGSVFPESASGPESQLVCPSSVFTGGHSASTKRLAVASVSPSLHGGLVSLTAGYLRIDEVGVAKGPQKDPDRPRTTGGGPRSLPSRPARH